MLCNSLRKLAGSLFQPSWKFWLSTIILSLQGPRCCDIEIKDLLYCLVLLFLPTYRYFFTAFIFFNDRKSESRSLLLRKSEAKKSKRTFLLKCIVPKTWSPAETWSLLLLQTLGKHLPWCCSCSIVSVLNFEGQKRG